LAGRAEPASPLQAPGEPTKGLRRTRYLAYLAQQADLQAATASAATRAQAGQAVYQSLIDATRRTHPPLVAYLAAQQQAGGVAAYEPFWVFNGLAVEGDLKTLLALAARPDVARIVAVRRVRLVRDTRQTFSSAGDSSSNWNINHIGAVKVWNELGITGEGAVVASLDTGVDWSHPALKPGYRGWDGSVAGHHYNWFDPDGILRPSGLGPSRTSQPNDPGAHGTHTTGTMVGDGGTHSTRIGVAPGARWIAATANGLDIGGDYTDDIVLHKALQFILAPTDLTGENPRPDLAPDVVNCSWGVGHGADSTFRLDIQALRAAGIVPVFASGNPSGGLGSVGSPAALPEAFAVGATDDADSVAGFSGRGPSFWEEIKPEVTAPGVDIFSSVPGGDYQGGWSGTSMAAPHASGVAALLRSADPTLSVDEIEAFIKATSVDLGDPGPDNRYGWGRIDAYRATQWALTHGWLRGQVLSSLDGAPIAGASVEGHRLEGDDSFRAASDDLGEYGLAAPEGAYRVEVRAFGFAPGTFPQVEVIRGFSSLVDFPLEPLPRVWLRGQVLANGAPVVGAAVRLVDTPAETTTNSQGQYELPVPPGTYNLEVAAVGFRRARVDNLIVVGDTLRDFALEPAPRLLLVEADAYNGWFVGWPVANYYLRALDNLGYACDQWVITDVTRAPSAEDLGEYDLVIWAHTYGSPGYMGLGPTIEAFLTGGGRLLLSGQDVAYRDNSSQYFSVLLHAGVQEQHAGEAQAHGADILDGLRLDFERVWADKRLPNMAVGFQPDELIARDGAPVPILMYERGSIAGLRVTSEDPARPYKAVVLGVGFESLGPPSAQEELLQRCLDWLTAPRASFDVAAYPATSSVTAPPGQPISIPVTVGNAGQTSDRYGVSVLSLDWPAELLDWETGTPLSQVGPLAPTAHKILGLRLSPPAEAPSGSKEYVAVQIASLGSPGLARTLSVLGISYPSWTSLPPLPESRYRGASGVIGGDLYAVGGWSESAASRSVYRYVPSGGSWQEQAELPAARANLSAAADGQYLYAVGGISGSYPDYTYHASIHRYHPDADVWDQEASLPRPLAGTASAVWGGRLYVFGGDQEGNDLDTVAIYDLAARTWSDGTPMPGGARVYPAAVPLGSSIYLLGGWPGKHDCERYLPAEDRWETCAPMRHGRQSPVATTDGRHIYVVGGGDAWSSVAEAERYDPQTDRWTPVPQPIYAQRIGALGGLVEGQLLVAGGTGENPTTDLAEALAVASSLAPSTIAVVPAEAFAGQPVTITISLWNPGADVLADCQFWNPIPPGLGFVPGSATGGAQYDQAANQVGWAGSVGAGAHKTFTYQAAVSPRPPAGSITTTLFVQDDSGMVYERQAAVTVLMSQPEGSTKAAQPSLVRSGETFTYTLRLRNRGNGPANVVVSDPLPGDVACLAPTLPPGAVYDPGTHTVEWVGTVPARVPQQPDYRWGDSDGGGEIPDVVYQWVQATDPITVSLGDDDSAGPLPIGFDFQFFDQTHASFYIGSNGLISFGGGVSTYGNQALPDTSPPNNLIAMEWDDLNPTAGGTIGYQMMGQAPERYLVVTFQGVPHYYNDYPQVFQVVLYEGSDQIRLQYQSVPGDGDGNSATVGWENGEGTRGFSYVYNGSGLGFPLHDGLALLLHPPTAGHDGEAIIPFQVQVSESLPCGSHIVNRAFLTDSLGITDTLAAEVRVDLADLPTESRFRPLQELARAGSHLGYEIVLANAGNHQAEAVLNNPLPPEVTDAFGWTGGLSYDPVARVMEWSGSISAGQAVTFTYSVTLSVSIPDGALVQNVLTATTPCGPPAILTATSAVYGADLSESCLLAEPAEVVPGERITYTLQVLNAGGAEADPLEATGVLAPGTQLLADTLLASTGLAEYEDSTRLLRWTAAVPSQGLATLRFSVLVLPSASGPAIVQTAVVTDVVGQTSYPLEASTRLRAAARRLHLPLLLKDN